MWEERLAARTIQVASALLRGPGRRPGLVASACMTARAQGIAAWRACSAFAAFCESVRCWPQLHPVILSETLVLLIEHSKTGERQRVVLVNPQVIAVCSAT